MMITSICTSGAHVIVLTRSSGRYGSSTDPEGVHDFEADLADGLVAAVEVTSEVDSERLDQAASTEHHISSLTVTNSQRRWLVALAEGASVKTIKRHLPQLLDDLEISGRLSTYGVDDYFDPVAQRLAALKIESVHAVQAKAGHEGTVNVQPGTYVGSAWDGPKIDEWLESLLASSRGVKKLESLIGPEPRNGILSSCWTHSVRLVSVLN
jgi:hypothetical protein